MKQVSIEYCVMWNYQPKAVSLAATLKNAVGIEALLIESSGGVFEVKVGDRLIFSKKREKRFPMHEEILEMLKNNRWTQILQRIQRPDDDRHLVIANGAQV